MQFKHTRKQWTIIIVTAITAMSITLAYCSPLDWFRKIDFELTGTVIDVDTKLPIEGAYAMAIYKVIDSDFFVSAIYCIKTNGMYTGKDGKFHFPIDKLDGWSPVEVTAIKPGYFLEDQVTWQKVNSERERYTGRDVHLQKQNPEKPDFHLGGVFCARPKFREDIEANIEYSKIEINEYTRLSANEIGIDSAKHFLQRLESTPTKTESKKK